MISINTKNSTELELRIKDILEKVLKDYSIVPVFTKEIIIDENSAPHSRPVLTLGTANIDPLIILKKFVHEQFHWFADTNTSYEECLEYLKKYNDLGDCNKSGEYPNSFWEHIIVCWNTRNFLKKVLSFEDLKYVYSSWQAYPLTEKFVEDNFDLLKLDLEKFNMVYNFNFS